jgi:MFS family permease
MKHKGMGDTLTITPAAQVLGGLLILLFGRRLFWIFVGVVGFFFGLQFGLQVFKGIAEWMLLLLSLFVGVVCAGLAVLFQRLVVILAGGLAGGMLALWMAEPAGLHTEGAQIVAFIAGAFLAAVMLAVLFDPVLIILSVVIGALKITEALPLDHMLLPLVFGLCLVVGFAVQVRSLRHQSRSLAS